MHRRTLLASTSTLPVAGCAGIPDGDSTDGSPSESTPEPPQRNFSAKAQDDTSLVVYNDSDYLRTDTTENGTEGVVIDTVTVEG